MAYDAPTSLTHSKIAAYTCPKRYHYIHVLGLSDTSDPARRGSTIHTANELYLKALVDAGVPSDFDLAQQCLQDAIVAETCPAHLVPDCELLWANHTERFELNLEAFLEAEQRRTVADFSFKPDYTYALPDCVELHDLKTHYQAITQDGAKKDLQARMYAFLASREWPGFQTYRFVWHFIRLNHTVSVDFAPDELDAIGRQLQSHAEAIARATEKDEWPASPGQQCAYCTFQCPAVDDAARMPARILDAAQAEQIAANLVVLKQAVSQQERVLSQYAALNGPVRAADHEYAHRPYERLSFPAEPVLAVLHGHSVDTSKFSFGATALKSYRTAKKYAYLKDDIDALAVVKIGTRFSAKKLHVEGEDESDADDE